MQSPYLFFAFGPSILSICTPARFLVFFSLLGGKACRTKKQCFATLRPAGSLLSPYDNYCRRILYPSIFHKGKHESKHRRSTRSQSQLTTSSFLPGSHSNDEQFKDIFFAKIDVDELPELSQELGIRAMPTFMLFKDGEKVGEVVGANPVALETAIKKNL